MGSGGTAGWLSDPLRPSASSIRVPNLPAGVLPTLHQGSRLKPGASKPSSEGGSRTSPSVSGFLQPSFPRQEGFGVLAPHHRSVDPEPLRHLVTLPHGDSSVSPELHSSRRLDDLPGPARRVSSGSSSSRFASFSSLRGIDGKPFQFRVLCFGLTTAPQVFTRIMAPVSAILHRHGVRMFRYLDDWLILASSEIACLQSRDRLLAVCTELGIQVNLTKSSLVPSQSIVYLGMEILSLPFIARPTPTRADNLIRLIEEFLSTPSPPAFLWRRLLGHLSSLILLVPGGMIRMRLLQLCPKDQWDFLDDQFQVSWSPLCREDLLWWSRKVQLREGVRTLSSSSGHQLLLGRFRRGLGSPSRRTPRLGSLAPPSESSLYQHEGASGSSARPSGLRTSDRGHVGSAVLQQHHHSSLSSSVGRDVFVHPELHGQRGSPLGGESTHSSPSPVHHGVVQRHRRRPESPKSGDRVRVDPSPGGSRSAGPQVASCDRSFCDRLDSEASGLLLSSLGSTGSGGGRPSPALGRSPSVRLSSDRHHKESSSQTEVIEELRVDSHSSVLASEGLVSRPSGTVIRRSHHTVRSKRSTKTAPLPPVPPKSAYASADCMATLKRFAIQAGFSPAVAGHCVCLIADSIISRGNPLFRP